MSAAIGTADAIAEGDSLTIVVLDQLGRDGIELHHRAIAVVAAGFRIEAELGAAGEPRLLMDRAVMAGVAGDDGITTGER